jgi:rhomboid protease GluP
LENILGPYRYSIIYFLSGLVASLSVVLFADPDTLTVGASGAIFGIIGALLILTFTKPRWFTQQGIKSIRQLMIINLIFTFIIPFISILAHVGGLIAGSIIIYFLTPDLPYYVKKNPMYLRRYKIVEEKTHYDA